MLHRSLPWRAAIGLAAFFALAAAPSAGAALTITPPQAVSGPSPFAPGCSGRPETGTNYENGEVEPWLTVNQANLSQVSGAWQQDRWSNGGAHGLVTNESSNGAGTFDGETYAMFSRCPLGPVRQDDPAEPGSKYNRASDPWVSYSPSGVLHQIALSVGPAERGLGNDTGILVSRSTDNGRTWSDPPIAIKEDTDPSAFNDKESITADPTDQAGNLVYAIWDRLVSSPGQPPSFHPAENAPAYRGPTWFTRSTDGGLSWEPARTIIDLGTQNQTIGNQIAVTPDGTLVDVFTAIFNHKDKKTGNFDDRLRGFSVGVSTSSDKGGHWTPPKIISSFVDQTVRTPGDGKALRTGDIIPDIGVDPKTGRLYVSWQDARSGTPAIYESTSTDGGANWSAPMRVSDTPKGPAFTGSIDVDANGRVAVTYYDFRNDPSVPGQALTDYWIQTSSDHGVTWSAAQRVTPSSFDMEKAPVARGFFVGDYEGLDHAGDTFKLGFVQTTPAAGNPTDVFVASAG